MTNLRTAALAAALSLSSIGAALAIPLNGSVAIGGDSYSDTGSLVVRTSYTPTNQGIAGLNGPSNAVTGNYTGLFIPAQNITFSTFNTTVPTSFSITGTNFTFQSSSIMIV